MVKEEVEVERVEDMGSLLKFPKQRHQVMRFWHGIILASFMHHSTVCIIVLNLYLCNIIQASF